MAILKWSVRAHKWIALIVGLQIVLWVAGGLVMSVIPIEQVRGEHKISEQQALSVQPGDMISLERATALANLESVTTASVGAVLGEPVWRLSGAKQDVVTLNAQTGQILSPIPEALAKAIADADYAGKGSISNTEWVIEPPPEYGRPGPVWRVVFDDGDHTTLYIDPALAEVRARRSSTWRVYDFFWKLHIMDYDDGEDFNHPLLITAAGAALFVALSGLILLFIKMRRSLLVWRRKRV